MTEPERNPSERSNELKLNNDRNADQPQKDGQNSWLIVITGALILLIIAAVSSDFAGEVWSRARAESFVGSAPLVNPDQIQNRAEPQSLGNVGSVRMWTKIEVTLQGPASIGMSSNSNPFLIFVDAELTSPGNRKYTVPAFFDGNGQGGMNGNVWKFRFSPDEAGTWQFTTLSAEPLLDNISGQFSVTPAGACPARTPGSLPDFKCTGRLISTGKHYLQFQDGTYWLKGGSDDPEDFLAPNVTVGFASKEAAIDYLAEHGANSVYLLLHNVDGDGNNVWPWAGETPAQAKTYSNYFDVAKLNEWEQLFSYIQDRGLVLHLVLEDDSAWTGFNRNLYYREMIARFGHHNGLYWNISEEYAENYSPDQIKNFAQLIRDLDPYDHPITVHHAGSLASWNPFLGDTRFDLTSFQTAKAPQNAEAVAWYGKTEASGRTIPVSFDETGKISAVDRAISRHIVWSVYLGGANFELHMSPLSRYQDFARHLCDLWLARYFMEHLPFWEMTPSNQLLSNGNGYALANPGETYAIYLPNGGSIDVDLSASSGVLAFQWFDPEGGAVTPADSISGGGTARFSSPLNGDAVLYIDADPTKMLRPYYLPLTATLN